MRAAKVKPASVARRLPSSLAAHDLDPVRIEGQMFGDLADAALRMLIGPDCVVVVRLAVADRIVVRLALVGAGRDAISAFEESS